jgi:hypothetical protein
MSNDFKIRYDHSPRTKSECRKEFDGSQDLFNSCWRKLLWFERNSDGAMSQLEAEEFLDMVCSELVNNSNSRFYIYG